MINRLFLLLIISVFTATANAQDNSAKSSLSDWIFGPSLGYQYQSGNFVKVSGWGLFAPNDDQYMKIDAGANFTWMQGKPRVIPELGFTYYLNNQLILPFVKGELTPYTITPKVGLSILSIVEVGVGYGFDYHTKKNFKSLDGVTVSLGLNIPFNLY